MGRTSSGVEVREKSIRIYFSHQGRQIKRTLELDGQALAPTPANVKHATRLVAEIKGKIRLGVFELRDYFTSEVDQGAGPAPKTLAQQLQHWLDAQRLETSTKKGYSSAIKFWATPLVDNSGLPLGEHALVDIKYSDLLRAIAIRGELTGKTLNNYVSVLREALELAVADGELTDNPAAKIKRFKHQKEPPDPFTAEERDRILAEFHARYPGQVANFVEFWFWSGLRTSEIFGLGWRNTDTASGTVVIKEAVVRGERKDRTKTNVARRVILNSQAAAAIQRQRAFTLVAGESVFHDPRYDHAWEDERAFRRSYWEPTLKRLGIRYRRPYNMRHTYATVMLMAGMNPAFCAKQLGHSIQMFHTTYARWLDGQQDDMEMARLEATLKGPLQARAG